MVHLSRQMDRSILVIVNNRRIGATLKKARESIDSIALDTVVKSSVSIIVSKIQIWNIYKKIMMQKVLQ